MSKSLAKRANLFKKFSSQLHLLKNEGLIEIELLYDETYICPLCLRQFEEKDLVSSTTENFLTEEDAPPAKLGGSRGCLTCKECNSKAGHQIENHLVKVLRDIDDSKFHKGTIQQRRIPFEDTFVNTQITSEGNGLLQVLHKFENNNPTTLDRFIYSLKTKSIGEILHINGPKQPSDPKKVNKALLKTNYIISFSKFGYIFLLDRYYDSIRQDITDADYESEGHLMLNQQFSSEQIGTYFVHNPNARAIFNVFGLDTQYSETIIGAFLPLPQSTPKMLHESLVNKGRRIAQDQVGVTLHTTHYDPNADLFNDVSEIRKIKTWTNNIR